MTKRMNGIMHLFYHVVTKQEIKRRRFTSCTRLAWFCLRKIKDSELDLTWDEAQEAAAYILEEVRAS